MAFRPEPLCITCNECDTSIIWAPRCDALDPHEGFALTQCTKCGSDDVERKPLDKPHSLETSHPIYSWFKKQLGD